MPTLDDALLTELIDLTFDHACTRPLSDLVDVGRVMATVDTLTEPARAARWQKRLWTPLRERLLERASKSAIPMEAWIPADIVASLRDELAKPAPIPKAWVDEMVGDERMREGVRAMLNESLTSFIQKASATLSENKAAGTGGLRGAIGWGARAAGSVLGGIGEEIQQRLQDRVRDYVDGAVAGVQARIGERLRSDETARAIGRRRVKAFEKFLKTTEAEAAKKTAKTPWERIDERGPRVIHHNLARVELRAAVRDELECVLNDLSGETLGSLLDDLGLRESTREALHHHALPGVRELVRTPGFEAWLARASATQPPSAAS